MSALPKNYLYILLILTGLGSIVDGFATMITLLNLFGDANILAYSFAILGSLFVYILTANHAITFSGPTPIKILGVISIILDIITSLVGTNYYVALGYPIGSPINFSNIWCCNWSNIVPTITALALAASFNISTLSVVGIWNSIRNQ